MGDGGTLCSSSFADGASVYQTIQFGSQYPKLLEHPRVWAMWVAFLEGDFLLQARTLKAPIGQ
jgi:hypothetical protein